MQHDKYVKHQEVKVYCAKKQFPELNFVGTHNKPYGVYGLGKNYHMHFYTKLGHGRYEICRIPCEFTLFTYCLDHPWVPGLPAQEQPRYKPIKDCTYWSVSDSFKNWNILNCHIRQHPVNKLTKYIKIYYILSVRTWLHC